MTAEKLAGTKLDEKLVAENAFPAPQEGAKATEMVVGPKLVYKVPLPDRISEKFWKENCHSYKFEKEAFDEKAVDGTISRSEFQTIVGATV